MPAQDHQYAVDVRWTGNTGTGTATYSGYARSHDIVIAGKPVIAGSADPGFRGDATKHNPEELLVAALSECHLLWFLGIAANSGVLVESYVDSATGAMREEAGGAGQFTEVVLRPTVTVADPGMAAKVPALHAKAHAMCFIARSVNFPVRHEPTTLVRG